MPILWVDKTDQQEPYNDKLFIVERAKNKDTARRFARLIDCLID